MMLGLGGSETMGTSWVCWSRELVGAVYYKTQDIEIEVEAGVEEDIGTERNTDIALDTVAGEGDIEVAVETEDTAAVADGAGNL